MLVRFVVENLFSFGDRREFTMIPNQRLQTLGHHKYSVGGFEILKIASVYGANGAGKSNLIKALWLLQYLVVSDDAPISLKNAQFKFTADENRPQILVVEFIQEETAFYYGIEFMDDLILSEELYLSGLGKEQDKLVFERKTDMAGSTTIQFLDSFEEDDKGQLLKTILLEEFVKPNKPIFRLIANRDNIFLRDVKKAFKWFDETLEIVAPESKPRSLAHEIDVDESFRKYAEDTLRSFHVGVTALTAAKQEIHEFFGENNTDELHRLIQQVEDSPQKILPLKRMSGKEEVVLVKERGKIWVKRLKIEHTGKDERHASFELEEESDGTVRLLDFIPAFRGITVENKVFVIDEIERSIHPSLIKALVEKFSLDSKTKGQLIFTTHESNLLDQKIFRQDEIWFVEKDNNGSTDLYSLNDFKEHKTIDIRKGYLSGRYGAVPFLANLQDLRWHEYDTNQ